MENSKWKPTQVDWRTQLSQDSRQLIINKITDTLKGHLPSYEPEGILEEIAVRFEEEIYSTATSQNDYLRRISIRMLTLGLKSQNTSVPNSLPSNSAVSNKKPSDPVPHGGMHSQVPNQWQLPIPLPNQAQASKQLLSQNIQNGVQSSTSWPSALPFVFGHNQSTMQNTVRKTTNSPNIQPSLSQLHILQNLLQPTQVQQNQLFGQQNSVPYMQQQQQLLGQQNNISNLHQQQWVPQNSIAGLQLKKSKHMLQQQLMSQCQLLPAQLQPQLGLQQQQPNPLQQRFQGLGSLLQTHNVIEQKQQFQSQGAVPAVPEASSTQTNHSNVGDWQEEVYQKIKYMKEMYLPDLTEVHQKITLKCQQADSLPQPSRPQIDKLKKRKIMLERIMKFLHMSKNNIPTSFREKIGEYEKQIVIFINNIRRAKNTTQASMMNSLKPSSTLESGQAPSSLQQCGVGSVWQNTTSAPQQANIALSQWGVNGFQRNMNPTQVNSNVLKRQNLTQPLLQSQKKKQMLSPSAPLAPSLILGDLEKQVSRISSLSYAGNVGLPKNTGVAMSPSHFVLFLMFFGIIVWHFICYGDA